MPVFCELGKDNVGLHRAGGSRSLLHRDIKKTLLNHCSVLLLLGIIPLHLANITPGYL